jgi:hypothetical protein
MKLACPGGRGCASMCAMAEQRLDGGYVDGAERRKPRPAWVHAEDTLIQVARWLREFHQIVAGFVPPSGAIWRGAARGRRA